jgi:hypothetical protein
MQAFMLDMVSGQIGLDKDQRKQMKSVLDEARAASKPVQEQIEKNRSALLAELKAGKTGDQLVKFHKTHGALEEKLSAAQSKAFTSVLAVLKPDQRANADMLFSAVLAMSTMEGRGGPMGMPGMMGPQRGGPRQGQTQ